MYYSFKNKIKTSNTCFFIDPLTADVKYIGD